MHDLTLGVVTLLGSLDAVIEGPYMVNNKLLEGLSLPSLQPSALEVVVVVLINLACDVCQGQDECLKIHSVKSRNLLFLLGDLTLFGEAARNVTVLRSVCWTSFLHKPCVPFK